MQKSGSLKCRSSSSVSPGSSVSNVDQAVAMPEFPFTGRINPDKITSLQASVLIKYYDACIGGSSGSVVSGSSGSSVSSGRNRRQRRKRKIAQGLLASSKVEDSHGCNMCDRAVELCRDSSAQDWAMSYVDVDARTFEVPGLPLLVHEVADGTCGFSKLSGDGLVVQAERNAVCADCHQFLNSCRCPDFSSCVMPVLVLRAGTVGLCEHVSGHEVNNPLRIDLASVKTYGAVGKVPTVPALTVVEMESQLGLVHKPVVGKSDPFNDGFCYLQLVKLRHRDGVMLRMQEWPLLQDLIQLPVDWFDMQAVNSLSICKVSDDKYHVVDALGLPKFRDTCASVVRNMRESLAGSLARTAMFWFVPDVLLSRPLSSASRVGGDLTLSQWLCSLTGVERVHDTFLVSRTAALLDGPARKQLKMLEALGDAGLSAVMARRCALNSGDSDAYQVARSSLASNAALSRLYVRRVPQHYVTVVAGVDPGKGKVGASIVEAFLGLIFLSDGFDALAIACEKLGVFDSG